MSGYVGQFRTTVRRKDGTRDELNLGAVVVATGGHEIEPTTYGYHELPGVITQHELETEFVNGAWDEQTPRAVVMIQCVGSRNEEHPYCSRICCSQAIKNALEIKRRSPETEIAILRHTHLWLPRAPVPRGAPGRRHVPRV